MQKKAQNLAGKCLLSGFPLQKLVLQASHVCEGWEMGPRLLLNERPVSHGLKMLLALPVSQQAASLESLE